MGILKRKTKGKLNNINKAKNFIIWLILYLTSIPLLFLILIIYPFYKIRIIELETRSVGHFSIPVEIFLNELKCEVYNSKRTLYLWYTNKKISNHFLFKKWKEHIIIGPRFLLFPLYKLINKFDSLKFLKSPYRNWNETTQDKLTHKKTWQVFDKYNVLKKTNPIIKFKKDEKKVLSRYLQKNKVQKNKYICFMSRSNVYLDDFISTRDASINNFVPALIKFCKKNNLKAIRMGAKNEERISVKSKYILDYCNTKDKNEKLDLLLPFYCQFFIGSDTGLTLLPILNRKKIAYTNFFNINNINKTTENMIPIILPKKIKKISTNKLIKFSEIFKKKLNEVLYEEDLRVMGYETVSNSSSEIYFLVSEMFKIFKKDVNKYSKLQKKFWNIFKKYYAFSPRNVKISDSFLKKNRDLIK